MGLSEAGHSLLFARAFRWPWYPWGVGLIRQLSLSSHRADYLFPPTFHFPFSPQGRGTREARSFFLLAVEGVTVTNEDAVGASSGDLS